MVKCKALTGSAVKGLRTYLLTLIKPVFKKCNAKTKLAITVHNVLQIDPLDGWFVQ